MPALRETMARLLHFNDRGVLFPLSNQALERLPFWRRTIMGLILLIILIVLLVGAAPTWPYSRQWGYYPSGGLGILLLILLILMLAHVINLGY
jgi:hypothetical protein